MDSDLTKLNIYELDIKFYFKGMKRFVKKLYFLNLDVAVEARKWFEAIIPNEESSVNLIECDLYTNNGEDIDSINHVFKVLCDNSFLFGEGILFGEDLAFFTTSAISKLGDIIPFESLAEDDSFCFDVTNISIYKLKRVSYRYAFVKKMYQEYEETEKARNAEQ